MNAHLSESDVKIDELPDAAACFLASPCYVEFRTQLLSRVCY